MKNTIKKNILSKVVLLASLVFVTNVSASSIDNEVKLGHIAKSIHSVEQLIAQFFDSGKKISYSRIRMEIEKHLQDVTKMMESATRTSGDALTKEINDVIDYALQQFSIAYNIIKKYEGRPSTEATAFATEIKRDFNTEKVFGELLGKFKMLKCNACQAGDGNVVKKVDTIIAMIEKKRKEWNAKADWVLFAGLKVRMDCK
jgi:hypothetical protein